jgi:hypothetical protein
MGVMVPSPENRVARLTTQRNGLIELLDELRAELAQTRVELDCERAISRGLIPRSYDPTGKTPLEVKREILAAAGAPSEGTPAQVHAAFDALIERRTVPVSTRGAMQGAN